MVDALFMVRAEKYDQWPFVGFADRGAAGEVAVSMHPDWTVEELMDVIKRVPVFDTYETVAPSYGRISTDDALRCSEEVPHGR